MAIRTFVYYDDAMLDHDPGLGHPERADRLRAIRTALQRDPIPGIEWVAPRSADRVHLERVHAPAYIDRIDQLRGRSASLDADTVVSPGSVAAAYVAAGAAIDAVDAVILGSASRAFLCVRPPGHHAERDRAMGFCLFNNIAIGAAHAIAAHGLCRILIVDWDVHHGNGTQHVFEAQSEVLVINSHQFPFWPGTGALEETGTGEGACFTVNLPLPAGAGDDEIGAVYREVVLPIAWEYRPDLILVSAGFDPHRNDPIAGMRMTAQGFAYLAGVLCEVAEHSASGRIIFSLEGGYDLAALAESVHAVLSVVAGAPPPPAPPPAAAAARTHIDRLLRFHAAHWRSLAH